MSDARRFVGAGEFEVTQLPWGPHDWLCKPGFVEAEKLLLVRVHMPAGKAHQFHRHPEMEEIIYVIEGQAEQWVDREKRILKPGEMAHIPMDMVHGTYNPIAGPLVFLAILSPAIIKGPPLVDVFRDDPWRTLKTPIEFG